MLPHVASSQCHLRPFSFSVRPDNLAMGTSFRWRVQSNDYVLHLHVLAAKTVDTPLTQGARSTDSVAIEYIIIYMQKVARKGDFFIISLRPLVHRAEVYE